MDELRFCKRRKKRNTQLAHTAEKGTEKSVVNKPDTTGNLKRCSFEKDRNQQAGFSKLENERRPIGLQEAIRGVGENGQTGQTIWKINLKQNARAAISKVKPSVLKQIQIKLMVAKSVLKDFNIKMCSKRGCPKRAPSYCFYMVDISKSNYFSPEI